LDRCIYLKENVRNFKENVFDDIMSND